MLKLYRLTPSKKEYWETWDNNNGSHEIHWGALGTRGESKTVKSGLFKKAEAVIQTQVDARLAEGFQPIDIEDHFIVLVEYAINRMGTKEDLEKRHRLQAFMDETLGWTGLGACDGGSIGSGTMEVCNYVVDFELAKSVIEKALANTEFANYTRIFDENAQGVVAI